MTTDTVVKTADVAPTRVPKSLAELKRPELLAAAQYFGTQEDGTNKEIIADLADAQVTFDDYAVAFLGAAPKAEDLAGISAPLDEEDFIDVPDEEEVAVQEIITRPAVPKLKTQDKYLLKFIGENPYFEFGKYKVSDEKPYVIMDAANAQKALENEPTKFRQAFPAELQEYYS